MGFMDRLKQVQEGVASAMEEQRAKEAAAAAAMPQSPPPPLLPGAAPEAEVVRLAAEADQMRAEIEAGTRERPRPRSGLARHVTTNRPVDAASYARARAIVEVIDISTTGDTRAILGVRVREPGGGARPRETADCPIGRKPARLLAYGLDVPVFLDPLDGSLQHIDGELLTEELRPRFNEASDRDAVFEPVRDAGQEVRNAASATRDLARWATRKGKE